MGIPFSLLPFGAIAIRVADVAAARARLEEAGVEFRGCNGAVFNDPDGNGLMIHRRYAPYPDGSQP